MCEGGMRYPDRKLPNLQLLPRTKMCIQKWMGPDGKFGLTLSLSLLSRLD